MRKVKLDWDHPFASSRTKLGKLLPFTRVDGKTIIAISRLGQYAFCPQSTRLQYIEQIPIEKTEAMVNGTDLHNKETADFFEAIQPGEEVDVDDFLEGAAGESRELKFFNGKYGLMGRVDIIYQEKGTLIILDKKPRQKYAGIYYDRRIVLSAYARLIIEGELIVKSSKLIGENSRRNTLTVKHFNAPKRCIVGLIDEETYEPLWLHEITPDDFEEVERVINAFRFRLDCPSREQFPPTYATRHSHTCNGCRMQPICEYQMP